MMQKKCYIFILLFLLLLPVLQGCATAEGGIAIRELNQLNVVMITGVDYDPKHKKFILSIQSVKPAKEKNAAISREVVYTTRATGNTLMEATKNMRAQTSGKLVWFHSKLIIFGRTLTQQKVLSEAVDFFARNREIRFSSWVLIAKNTAEEIVTAHPTGEVTMGDELSGIINNQSEWGRTVIVNLRDLINSYANPYEGFVTGQVSKVKGKDKKEQIIITDGVVVNSASLNQNPYVTLLPKKEVRSLRLLQRINQQDPEVIYSISLTKEKGEKEKKFNTALQLKVKHRKQSSVIENGKPRIKVDLTLEGTILETGTQLDLTKRETMQHLENIIERKMKQDVRILLDRIQKKDKIDIFNFASLIHRQHKQYWYKNKNQWKEIYPTIPIDIHIHWSTLRNGMISQMKAGETK